MVRIMVKIKERIPKKEIEKWLKKLREEMKLIKFKDEKGKELLKNINAYILITPFSFCPILLIF